MPSSPPDTGGTLLTIRSGLSVTRADPASDAAVMLMEQLSAALSQITGDSGTSSFDPQDACGAQACFLLAHDAQARVVGCGALRPLRTGVAEIKRTYARPGTGGVGAAVLARLEIEAVSMGYAAVWLATRLVNQRAVAFYQKHGYRRIANYGKYAGNAQAVCFAKRLAASCRCLRAC